MIIGLDKNESMMIGCLIW